MAHTRLHSLSQSDASLLSGSILDTTVEREGKITQQLRAKKQNLLLSKTTHKKKKGMLEKKKVSECTRNYAVHTDILL